MLGLYQQKCRDQQWYITQLENDNHHLHNEIKILREKTHFLMSNKRRSLPSTVKNDNEQILSTSPRTDNHQQEDNAGKTNIVDATRRNEQQQQEDDDDDEHTSLEVINKQMFFFSFENIVCF